MSLNGQARGSEITASTVVSGLLDLSKFTKRLHEGCVSIQDEGTEVWDWLDNHYILIKIRSTDLEQALREFFEIASTECHEWSANGTSKAAADLAHKLIAEGKR